MAAESHDEFYIDASHINNDVLEVSGASDVSEQFKIYCQNWGFSQNGVIAAADDTAGDACAVSATTTTTSHESTTSSSSDCRCDDDDDNCPHSKHYCTQTQDIVTSSCHTDVSDDSISYFFDPPPHPRVSELREENRLENEVVRRVSDAERETSQHYMKLMLAEAAAAATTAIGAEATGGGDDDDVMMCSDGDVFDETNVGESVAPAAEHSRAAISSQRLADVLEHPFRSLEHPFRSLERTQCSQSFKSLTGWQNNKTSSPPQRCLFHFSLFCIARDDTADILTLIVFFFLFLFQAFRAASVSTLRIRAPTATPNEEPTAAAAAT